MDLKFNKRSSLGAIAALVLSLAALPGCGYNGEDLCDDTCDCQGCSDVEYDNCIDEADDLERRVDDQGCGDFYDDYLACSGDEFACLNGQADTDGCEPELGRVLNCLL